MTDVVLTGKTRKFNSSITSSKGSLVVVVLVLSGDTRNSKLNSSMTSSRGEKMLKTINQSNYVSYIIILTGLYLMILEPL